MVRDVSPDVDVINVLGRSGVRDLDAVAGAARQLVVEDPDAARWRVDLDAVDVLILGRREVSAVVNAIVVDDVAHAADGDLAGRQIAVDVVVSKSDVVRLSDPSEDDRALVARDEWVEDPLDVL